MGALIKRLTATFDAVDDAGQTHTICVFTDFIKVDTFQGSSEVEGLKEMRTSAGDAINFVKKGEYKTLFGKTLRATSPDAP